MTVYCGQEPEDERDWSEEECDCGNMYDMGPPWYHSTCPVCRKRAREHATACKVKMEAIILTVKNAMNAECRL